MGLFTLCIGLFSLYDVDTPWSMIYGFTVIGGAGMGLNFSSTIIAIQAAAEPRDVGKLYSYRKGKGTEERNVY